ncbi:MAG: polysaccharide biosynthesis C-terminal domain-containing protein [Oscillospiraceae bacterium]|nr:polysaccharide biosynthesis C-terminal domain-containing protein [Oscillospiraceae bacterium]
MDKYKKLASNTMILAAGQFSSRFLVIIMMRFYTGMLSTDGYGTVGLIIDACMIIMAIVSLSVNESVIRFGLDTKYDKAHVFSIGLSTVIFGLAIFAPIAPALNQVPMFAGYAWWIYFYVMFGCIKSCCSLFVRSIGHVRLFAVDGLFTTVMNISFNLIFMLALDMGVRGFLLSVILADAASVIFVFVMADLRKYIRVRGLIRELNYLRGSMYRFSLPMIPTAVMWWVTGFSAGFFIEAFLDIDATGLFKAAFRLPNIIVIVSGIFSQAWNMSAITEKNSRTIANFYTNVFKIFQSAIYLMAAGLLLVIRPALQLMTSPEFAGSYRISSILIIAIVFTCFSTFLGSVYVASKKSVRSMLTALIGAAASIVFNVALIPLLGLYGAAISIFLSYTAVFIVRAVDTRKIVRMELGLSKMFANLAVIAAMCVVVIFVQDTFVYYVALSALFTVCAVINFGSAISAIKMVLRKKTEG